MSSNSKKCPSCHEENKIIAKFCKRCGYNFEDNEGINDITFINDKLSELYLITGVNNNTRTFKVFLKNNGLSKKDGEDIRREVENLIKNNNAPKNIDGYVNELVKLKAKDNALKLLDLRVGDNADRFFFKSRLYGESLNRDPHGFNIYNELKKLIEEGEVTNTNFDDEFERLIKREINDKNNVLKNRLNQEIGEEKINPEFLEKISKYHLTEEDAFQIKDEMLDKINGRFVSVSLDEYDEELENIINQKASIRSEEILSQEQEELKEKLKRDLNELVGENFPSLYFEDVLNKHNLTTFDGNNIKADLISQIDKLNVAEGQLEEKLDEIVKKYEYDDVKKELGKLSSKELDQFLLKYSISVLIPLKFTKIEKLMNSVDIPKIKYDLYLMGIQKYEPFEEEITSEKSCPKCGHMNREHAKFCINCGIKFN